LAENAVDVDVMDHLPLVTMLMPIGVTDILSLLVGKYDVLVMVIFFGVPVGRIENQFLTFFDSGTFCFSHSGS
jgi:hypothetical protein